MWFEEEEGIIPSNTNFTLFIRKRMRIFAAERLPGCKIGKIQLIADGGISHLARFQHEGRVVTLTGDIDNGLYYITIQFS